MVLSSAFLTGIISAIVITGIFLVIIFIPPGLIHPQLSPPPPPPPPITISFNNASYYPNTAAKITVIDPSANINNTVREKIIVQVYSDSDSVGIPVQLEEYRVDSAKFVTHPYLVKLTTQSSNPSIAALQIKSGDTIYAKYVGLITTASITYPTYPNLSNETKILGSGGINMTGNTNPNLVLTNSFPTSGVLNPTGTSISASTIPVLACFDDIDSDGICDEWENVASTGVNGLAIPYHDATYILNCQTSVANDCPGSDKQDIYVQASYMQNPNISQAPTSTEISDLQEKFLAHGIRLHILPDTQSIGYYNDLTTVPGNPGDSPGTNSFFGIKNAYFGSPQERTCTNPPSPYSSCTSYLHDYLTAKAQVFHYALFIHAQNGSPGSSGWAEIFGNDMVISLGAFGGGIGSEPQLAGTFMHELGHNLNLNHGGASTDFLNCKPNYLSVMSYTRQFPYFVTNWNLDYSNTRFDLNENSLHENRGIGTTSQLVTAYSYNNGLKIGQGPTTINNAGIDWDGSGTVTSSVLVPPTVIRNLGIPDCSSTTPSKLNGFDDWSSLNFTFQSSSNFANGAAYTPNPEREMTRGDVDTLFMNEYNVNSTGKNLDELYKYILNENKNENNNTIIKR